MTSCESRSKGAVLGCYGGDSGTISGSGGGKVGDGVDSFLLVELRCILFLQVIGGVEFSTGGGALRFTPIVVCSGKESFEAGSSFLLCKETFLGFAVIDEEKSLINDLEGDSNFFFKAVGSVTGGGIVTAIFDPVEKGFNRLDNIVWVRKTASFS